MADYRGAPLDPARLARHCGDLRQLASVRRLTLDDGPEAGVKALAFDTGGGLSFWVLEGRGLDIGPLSWRGLPCAWQGPGGFFRHPGLIDAEAEDGRGLMRGFSGFLVTCGLEHIRQPGDGHPLHGRLPFTPARLTAQGERWEGGEPVVFCEGDVVQAAVGGEVWRLRRRIEAPIGGGTIRLVDEVENRSTVARPQAILYHLNLGYPFLGPESEVRLDGKPILGRIGPPDSDSAPEVMCRPASPNGRSLCEVKGAAASLTLAFDTTTLPWLQTWLDRRPGMYVLGVEPCTSDRRLDGTSTDELPLAPGERRRYALELTFAG